jgi:hypothetical protein
MNAHSLVLGAHIAAGASAFLFAPLALVTQKGGRAHRRWGKIYFWSMVAVSLTAFALVFRFHASPFLAVVAVFSFYLAAGGYRVLARKDGRARALDWIVSGFGAASGLGLCGWSAWGIFRGGTFNPIVLGVFGVLALLFAASEVRSFLRPPEDKRHWWYTHLRGMIAAYIATVTAFSSVNFKFLPMTARWLWPTAVGIAGITVWIRYYRRRFAREA